MPLPVLQSGGFGLSQPMQAAITGLVDALLGLTVTNVAGTVTITAPGTVALENTTLGIISPRAVRMTQLRLNSIPDATGTPGAATQTAVAGKAAIAAGASSVVITNTLCSAASVILLTNISLDATAKTLRVTTGAGSFTVSSDVATTAAMSFGWMIVTL